MLIRFLLLNVIKNALNDHARNFCDNITFQFFFSCFVLTSINRTMKNKKSDLSDFAFGQVKLGMLLLVLQ